MIENIVTRHYFNNIAGQWNNRQTTEPAKIGHLLSRLDWQNCHTVLDIGCGTGILFPFIEKMTRGRAKIFAMDFAEGMVRKAAQNKVAAIQVLCGCARYLPFYPNSIDRIIAFHVFPHIQGLQLALNECWRILKPLGELAIIHLHSSEEINAIHETIGGMIRDHKLPSIEQMCRMLAQTDFEIKTAVDQSGVYFIGAIKVLHRVKNESQLSATA